MATLSNNELKNGTVFKDGSDVYSVIKYEHNFRGRGGGIVKVKVRNIKTGAVQEKTYRNNEKVESVDTHKSNVQFMYSDGNEAHFMDPESFEQCTLSADALGSGAKFLKEGEKVVALFLDGKPISIEVPLTVELRVTQAPPGAKGNSANNPTKKVVVENGVELDVPLFIKEGDVLKINTEDGSYSSRV